MMSFLQRVLLHSLVCLVALPMAGCWQQPMGIQAQSFTPSMQATFEEKKEEKKILRLQNAECRAAIEKSKRETDVKEIYELASKSILKKDEFETSRAYSERSSKALESIEKKLVQKNGNAYVILILPLTDVFKYDADTKILSARSDYSGIYNFDTAYLNGKYEDRWLVNITHKTVTSESTYVGENGFGVKKQILKRRTNEFGIVFAPSEKYSGAWPSEKSSVAISMQPDAARTSKAQLRTVIAGKIIPPVAADYVDGQTPKLNAPYDITRLIHVITISVNCAAIKNIKTSEILYDLI